MGWTTEVLWFDSQQMYKTFLFSKPFQLAVQSTQPHVKWVLGTLPQRHKWPRHEDVYSCMSGVKIKNKWNYMSLPHLPSWLAWG